MDQVTKLLMFRVSGLRQYVQGNCSQLPTEVVTMLQANPAVYVTATIRGTKESPGPT